MIPSSNNCAKELQKQRGKGPIHTHLSVHCTEKGHSASSSQALVVEKVMSLGSERTVASFSEKKSLVFGKPVG